MKLLDAPARAFGFLVGDRTGLSIEDLTRKRVIVMVCLTFAMATIVLTGVSLAVDGLQPRRLIGVTGTLVFLAIAGTVRLFDSARAPSYLFLTLLTVILVYYSAISGGIAGFTTPLLLVSPFAAVLFLRSREAVLFPLAIAVYAWIDFFVRGGSVLDFNAVMVPTALTCTLVSVAILSGAFTQITTTGYDALADSESRAREALDRIEQVSENVPVGIFEFEFDEHGQEHIRYHNTLFETLLDVTSDQVMVERRPAMVNVVEEDMPELQRSINEAVERKAVWNCDFRVRRADGAVIWVSGRSKPYPKPDGGYVWYGSLIDITALKQTETALQAAKERAEAANRAKSNFISTISHELRTPLNGVLGMSQLLAQSRLDDKQRKYLDTLVSSGRSLIGLVDDILDIARIEAGRTKLQVSVVDLGELLNSAHAAVVALAEAKTLRLSVTPPAAADRFFRGDPTRLLQILINFASNAVKFTEHGDVRIGAAVTPSGEVELYVADTGIGIAPEIGDAVFERFSQADTSRTRAYEGAGLGLAISKELVELMGGSIGYESEPGRGSRFWARIPLARAEAAERETERAGAASKAEAMCAGPARSSARTVLVVDDNAVNLETAAAALETLPDIQVFSATNGAEAIDVLESAAVDLVLMDIRMPVMSGDEAIRQIRGSDKPYKDVPILILTADVVAGNLQEYASLGANGLVAKPFVIPDLLASAERLLAADAAMTPRAATS